MPLEILIPPAVEPVSVAQAKAFCRIDHAEEDGLLSDLIGAAREAVEAASGRALVERRVRERLDGFAPPWSIAQDRPLRLALRPLKTLHALRVFAADGTAQTLDPAAYVVDPAADAARVAPGPGGWPVASRAVSAVEADYTAGYGPTGADAPAALRQAVLRLVADAYARRDGGDGPADPARLEVAGLIAPFAQARL